VINTTPQAILFIFFQIFSFISSGLSCNPRASSKFCTFRAFNTSHLHNPKLFVPLNFTTSSLYGDNFVYSSQQKNYSHRMFLWPCLLQFNQPHKYNNYGMIYEIKKRFLPSIETLRRVSNWSLHRNVVDEIQPNKNPIFIHSKLEISKNQAPNQDPFHQTKPKHCLELWYHLLVL